MKSEKEIRKKSLRQRIIDEMIVSPKDKIEFELWHEIGYRYKDFKEFHKEFERAKNKVLDE